MAGHLCLHSRLTVSEQRTSRSPKRKNRRRKTSPSRYPWRASRRLPDWRRHPEWPALSQLSPVASKPPTSSSSGRPLPGRQQSPTAARGRCTKSFRRNRRTSADSWAASADTMSAPSPMSAPRSLFSAKNAEPRSVFLSVVCRVVRC